MKYSLNSLDRILEKLEQQPGWEQYQQYRCLLQGWHAVVDSKIAENARPLYVARKILWVATSSSTWAQEISLRRYNLLKKLNTQLPFELVDLRCSPAGWHKQTVIPANHLSTEQQQHPSQVAIDLTTSPVTEHNLPIDTSTSNSGNKESQQLTASFQRWAKTIQARSHNLPLCPQCHSPTPNGELQRWDVCYYCTAQKWSQNPR
jgi:predicted nucleic acid-binding Zn ribbon protein